MTLALSSRRAREGGEFLARAATEAKDLGFSAVFAARPPKDAARARRVLQRLGLEVAGVASDPVEKVTDLSAALDRAAEAAAVLRRPLVALDLGGVALGPGASAEEAVEGLARALFGAVARWPGLEVALVPAGRRPGLLDFAATGWLLDALDERSVGLWLDPVRVDPEGPSAIAWAERHARRALGVYVHEVRQGRPHAIPEGDDPTWRALRDLLPSRAARVLDVSPEASSAAVLDARRRWEGR